VLSRPEVQVSPRHPRRLLLVCLTGMFATSFPITILTISIKPIADELHSLPTTVTWVTTAPVLAAAVATPVLGRVGDMRGHRRVYLVGLTVAVVFAALTAVAWDAASLITFRTLSQLGASGTVPATFAMVFRAFPRDQRVRASAMASATFASAAVIGVAVGGPIVDWVGWRPIFVIQAALALLSLLPALVVLPADSEHTDESIDYAGAAALAVTTFAVTFGINRLGVWGATPVVLATLAVAPAALALLVRLERHAVNPILPLELLRTRQVRVVAAASFIVGAGWMGSFIVTPLLLQAVMGLSAGMTSLVSVPRAGFVAVASPAAGRIGVRVGVRRLVVGAATGVAVSFVVLAAGAGTGSVVVVAVALAAGGWAFGHLQPGLLTAVANAVDEHHFGMSTSLQQTANQIGAVVGMGLFTAVAADARGPAPFVWVYLTAALSAVCCAIVALWLDDTAGAFRPVAVVADDGHEPALRDQLVHPLTEPERRGVIT
jgi:MFS family permease